MDSDYRRAISCSLALKSRASLYREQGFSGVPIQMEARAQLFEQEATVAGGRLGKSQIQIVTDLKDSVEKQLGSLTDVKSDKQRQQYLKRLNDEVDECSSEAVSTAN